MQKPINTLTPSKRRLRDENSRSSVTFIGGDCSALRGTLQVPRKTKEFGSILLLQGGGPTDLNGNQLPYLKTDLMKDLALAACEIGVCSLRFDKRGMHKNKRLRPADQREWISFFSWASFVEDALAAYRFLFVDQIDQPPPAILGHSEGALLAIEVAHRLRRDSGLDVPLILLSAPGQPFKDIISRQVLDLSRLSRVDVSERKIKQKLKWLQNQIIDTGDIPPVKEPLLRAFFPSYAGVFFQQLFKIDFREIATSIRSPIFLIYGEQDQQIDPDTDKSILENAFRSNSKEIKSLTIADADHNFMGVSRNRQKLSVRHQLTNSVKSWLQAQFERESS